MRWEEREVIVSQLVYEDPKECQQICEEYREEYSNPNLVVCALTEIN
jgi:hypothetical protein